MKLETAIDKLKEWLFGADYRVGYAAVYNNRFSPAGSMSSFETASTIYTVGRQYVKARGHIKAREIVRRNLEESCMEQLIRVDHWNTFKINADEKKSNTCIYGLTPR